MNSHPIKRVLLACPGIGHINRGFESFTTECFQALSGSTKIEIWLAKGAGLSYEHEIKIPIIKRGNLAARLLSNLIGRDPYFIEQLSFSISLITVIRRLQPNLIFFSDGTLGNILSRIRGRITPDFKLLFSNGGPLLPPYCKCDHIQQVLPDMIDQYDSNQTFLPYGFKITKSHDMIDSRNRVALKQKLGIPTESIVALSVASLSIKHKRIDYLISEIAKLNTDKIFLLLLGEIGDETSLLEAQANRLLGSKRFKMLSVPYSEINDYYRCADIFCHTALQEGFGRSLVEAQSHGLTVFCHQSAGNKFILANFAKYGDLTKEGVLSILINDYLKNNRDLHKDAALIHQNVYSRFSWDLLSEKYIELFLKVIEADEA